MTRLSLLGLAVVVVACGPPLNAGRDGGSDGSSEGGSEGGSGARVATTCPSPAPNGCGLLGSTGLICSVRDFGEPTTGGQCQMNTTNGTMTATVRQASGDQPFTAERVAARRLTDEFVEIVGVETNNAIRIVVPAKVGTHACTKATGAWIVFTSFIGSTFTGAEGKGAGTITLATVGGQVSGTFSVDDEVDIVNGSFSVTLAN